MRAYVVSLARDVDRRARFSQHWAEVVGGPAPQWWDATEPSVTQVPEPWHHIGRSGLGCALSHRALWEHELDEMLVLEDDVVLASDFALQLPRLLLELPADWDILYLGGEHELAPRPATANLARCVRTHRTHAYVVRSGTRLLEATRGLVGHIDMALIDSGVVAYAANPWIAGQAAGFSHITRRQEPERWWAT